MCSIRKKKLTKQHLSLTWLADRRSLWCVILGAPPSSPYMPTLVVPDWAGLESEPCQKTFRPG